MFDFPGFRPKPWEEETSEAFFLSPWEEVPESFLVLFTGIVRWLRFFVLFCFFRSELLLPTRWCCLRCWGVLRDDMISLHRNAVPVKCKFRLASTFSPHRQQWVQSEEEGREFRISVYAMGFYYSACNEHRRPGGRGFSFEQTSSSIKPGLSARRNID